MPRRVVPQLAGQAARDLCTHRTNADALIKQKPKGTYGLYTGIPVTTALRWQPA